MILSINKEHFLIKIQNEAKVGKWIFQLSAAVVCLVAVPVMPTHAVKSLQSERSKKKCTRLFTLAQDTSLRLNVLSLHHSNTEMCMNHYKVMCSGSSSSTSFYCQQMEEKWREE